MKKTFFAVLVLCALAGAAHAVEINLSSDKEETPVSGDIMRVSMKTGETITFHVKVTDGGSSAGSFTLSRQVEQNRFNAIGSPHFVVASCGCKGVTGKGEIDEYLPYTPAEPGTYRADATYGGRGKRIEFLVEGDPAGSIEPAAAAAKATTSTTSSHAPTTTTTTTTTYMETTTTFAEEPALTTQPHLLQNSSEPDSTAVMAPVAANPSSCGCKNNYLLLLAFPLALVFVYLGRRFNLIK